MKITVNAAPPPPAGSEVAEDSYIFKHETLNNVDDRLRFRFDKNKGYWHIFLLFNNRGMVNLKGLLIPGQIVPQVHTVMRWDTRERGELRLEKVVEFLNSIDPFRGLGSPEQNMRKIFKKEAEEDAKRIRDAKDARENRMSDYTDNVFINITKPQIDHSLTTEVSADLTHGKDVDHGKPESCNPA